MPEPPIVWPTPAEPRPGAVDWRNRSPVLVETLGVAVPLRIQELRSLPAAVRVRAMTTWADAAADAVASHGDDLLFGSKEKGAAARAFNHLARGLAALAFCPGGVTFAGMHFEVPQPEDQLQRAVTTLRASLLDAQDRIAEGQDGDRS